MYGLLKKSLVCWILLGSVIASYGQTPSPTEPTGKPKQHATTGHNSAKPDQRGTENSPLVIKVIPTPKTQEEAEKEAQQHEDKQTTDRWLMRFTGLLAVFTLILAFFTAKLWWEAKSTAQKQLRAYVSIEEFGLGRFDTALPQFTFRSHNNGRTPAHDVRLFTFIGVLPYPLPKNFPHDDVREDTGVSKTTIGPGVYQRGAKTIASALTPTEIADVINGSAKRLYFMGVAKYLDVFKEPHETWFCVAVGGPTLAKMIAQQTPPGVDVPATGLFAYCDQINNST